MNPWKTAVEPTARCVRILVTDANDNEILKAALPSIPQHPRALLTLLESLAMWVGHPLNAVTSVGPQSPRRCDEALFGDGLLPLDSALVRFEMAGPTGRRRTIAGLGDFRHLRLVQRRSR